MTNNYLDKLFSPSGIANTVLAIFAIVGFITTYNGLDPFQKGMVVGSIITFASLAVYYILGKVWNEIKKPKVPRKKRKEETTTQEKTP